MLLQRQMMSAEEKRAAHQRIRQARSVRVRQMEQDRLNAAIEAEAQLLQLVEATASETGSARRRDKRRVREDAERQQRMAHGMKRPRGLYENAEDRQPPPSPAEENDEEEEEEDDEGEKAEHQQQAEDDETKVDGDNTPMADDQREHSKHSGGSSGDDEHLSRRLVSTNGAPQAETRELNLSEGEEETQPPSRAGKAEIYLYTPLFPRGKFGFSSFIKQAVSAHS